MEMQPLHSTVIIVRDEADSVTKGGIILPTEAQEKPKMGTVLAVGPGKIDPKTGEPTVMQVQANQRVLFKGYAGMDLKLEGKEYVLIEESEILAILR